MRLLLLALGAWTFWKISEENRFFDRRQMLPIPARPLPRQTAATRRKSR